MSTLLNKLNIHKNKNKIKNENENENDYIVKYNTKNVINDNLIQYYLMTIDNKNKEDIKFLNKNNKCNVEKDIVYEIYNKNELNSERLQFIVDNCSAYLIISSSLIKILMKNNNKKLLEILFKNYLKFFDNNFILNLLSYHSFYKIYYLIYHIYI